MTEAIHNTTQVQTPEVTEVRLVSHQLVKVEFTFTEVFKLVFYAGLSALILVPVYMIMAAMFGAFLTGLLR